MINDYYIRYSHANYCLPLFELNSHKYSMQSEIFQVPVNIREMVFLRTGRASLTLFLSGFVSVIWTRHPPLSFPSLFLT